MAENKKSFVLQIDLLKDVQLLSDEDAGRLFKAIFTYVNGLPVEINESLSTLYNKITSSIEVEWAKYNPKTDRYHWNYKGGITPENKAIRNSDKMAYWRVQVFERDSYICQHCGQVGGILHAHHVKEFAKYPELRFEITNGLTLCKKCHNKKHSKNG